MRRRFPKSEPLKHKERRVYIFRDTPPQRDYRESIPTNIYNQIRQQDSSRAIKEKEQAKDMKRYYGDFSVYNTRRKIIARIAKAKVIEAESKVVTEKVIKPKKASRLRLLNAE